jgi:hypothetical protein
MKHAAISSKANFRGLVTGLGRRILIVSPKNIKPRKGAKVSPDSWRTPEQTWAPTLGFTSKADDS